jgi:hypothetical protein
VELNTLWTMSGRIGWIKEGKNIMQKVGNTEDMKQGL